MEDDKNNPNTEPSPEFWAEKVREFIEITDEVTDLREKQIEQIFEDEGLDYAAALSSVDIESEEEEQLTEEAEIYLQLVETLAAEEDYIARHATKLNPDDNFMRFIAAGRLVQGQHTTEDDMPVNKYQLYKVEDGQIVVLNFTTPRGKWSEDFMQMMEEGLDNGSLRWEPLEAHKAESLINWMKVVRRWVGQDLYGRQPLPEDPS